MEGEVVWTTQDGVDIPIEKLEDRHLCDIIKYLERKYGEDLPKIYYDILQVGTLRKLPMCVERFNILTVEETFEQVKEKRLEESEWNNVFDGDWMGWDFWDAD